MATITKRGNTFRARVRLAGFKKKSKTFDTRKAAEAWGAEQERECNRGTNDDTDANRATEPTLHEALETYAKDFTIHKAGAKQEMRRIRTWQAHEVARLKLSRLKVAHFREYIKEREAAGISGSTLISDLAIISNVFDAAKKDWGYSYLENPLDLVRRPKPNLARERRLTDEELAAAAAAFSAYPHPWTPFIIEWAQETAMRKGEIRNLLECNIDVGRRTVTVPARIAKTRVSRVIALSKAALDILARRPPKQSPLAFPISDSTIARAMKRVREQTGIKDFEFRDTRREGTSRLAERGFSAPEMQRVTGHKTMQLLQVYTKLDVTHMLTRLDATQPAGTVPSGTGGEPLTSSEREELTQLRQEKQRLWSELRSIIGAAPSTEGLRGSPESVST